MDYFLRYCIDKLDYKLKIRSSRISDLKLNVQTPDQKPYLITVAILDYTTISTNFKTS